MQSILAEDFELTKLAQETYRVMIYYNEHYGEIKEANRGNAEWSE